MPVGSEIVLSPKLSDLCRIQPYQMKSSGSTGNWKDPKKKRKWKLYVYRERKSQLTWLPESGQSEKWTSSEQAVYGLTSPWPRRASIWWREKQQRSSSRTVESYKFLTIGRIQEKENVQYLCWKSIISKQQGSFTSDLKGFWKHIPNNCTSCMHMKPAIPGTQRPAEVTMSTWRKESTLTSSKKKKKKKEREERGEGKNRPQGKC